MADQPVVCPKCGHTESFHGHALVWVEVTSGGAGYAFSWADIANFGPYCGKCGTYIGTANAERLKEEMKRQLAQFQQES